jgi:hypothetical protein
VKAAEARAILCAGIAYLLAGIVFGELAGRATSLQERVEWRWAAWAVSAIAFGAHIAYGQLRLRNAPRRTAYHAALGAAIGAFGLAAMANIHSLSVSPAKRSILLLLSLVLWPLLTALPAFVVALVAAFLLQRVRQIA